MTGPFIPLGAIIPKGTFGVKVLESGVPHGTVTSLNFGGDGINMTISGVTANVNVAGGSISLVAADILNAFDPVTILGNLADSGNTAHLGKVAGIAQTAAGIGFAATVVASGLIQNAGWSWTAGDVIFLNGTTLSKVAPSTGFIQRIGKAEASDAIYVSLDTPIKL